MLNIIRVTWASIRSENPSSLSCCSENDSGPRVTWRWTRWGQWRPTRLMVSSSQKSWSVKEVSWGSLENNVLIFGFQLHSANSNRKQSLSCKWRIYILHMNVNNKTFTELTSLDWRTSCFTSSYTFWLLTISSNTRWLQWHPRNSFNSSLDPEKNKDQALKIFWRSVGEFLHLILILCSNALNSSFCKHFGMSSVFEKLTIPVSNILTIFLMTSIFSLTGLDMYSDVVFSLSKTAGFTWNLLVFCFEKCGVNSVILTHW